MKIRDSSGREVSLLSDDIPATAEIGSVEHPNEALPEVLTPAASGPAQSSGYQKADRDVHRTPGDIGPQAIQPVDAPEGKVLEVAKDPLIESHLEALSRLGAQLSQDTKAQMSVAAESFSKPAADDVPVEPVTAPVVPVTAPVVPVATPVVVPPQTTTPPADPNGDTPA